MNIFVSTLGKSWPIVPEVFGFLRPDILDLFRHHPRLQRIEADREELGVRPDEICEIWLLTTCGTEAAQQKVARWWQLLGEPLPLRIWVAGSVTDLDTPEECDQMRELIFRACLRA